MLLTDYSWNKLSECLPPLHQEQGQIKYLESDYVIVTFKDKTAGIAKLNIFPVIHDHNSDIWDNHIRTEDFKIELQATWENLDKNQDALIKLDDVVAWMPLPKAYREP